MASYRGRSRAVRPRVGHRQLPYLDGVCYPRANTDEEFLVPVRQRPHIPVWLSPGRYLFAYESVGIAGYAWVFWRLSGQRVVLTCLAVLGLVLATPLIGEFPRYGFALMLSARVLCSPGDSRSKEPFLGTARAISAGCRRCLHRSGSPGLCGRRESLPWSVLECAGMIWPPNFESGRKSRHGANGSLVCAETYLAPPSQ